MDVLTTISSLSIFPAIIIAILFKGRFKSFAFTKPLLALVLLGLIGDISTYILAMWSVNNMPIFHFFTLFEFSLIALLFATESSKKRNYKLGVLIFWIVGIVNMLFFETILEFNSYGSMIEALAIIGLCLIWFNKTFKELKIERLSDYPMFIVASGILIYFAGNFFIFTYYNIMLAIDAKVMNEIWHIHSFLNIIYNLILALALWKMRASSQSA